MSGSKKPGRGGGEAKSLPDASTTDENTGRRGIRPDDAEARTALLRAEQSEELFGKMRALEAYSKYSDKELRRMAVLMAHDEKVPSEADIQADLRENAVCVWVHRKDIERANWQRNLEIEDDKKHGRESHVRLWLFVEPEPYANERIFFSRAMATTGQHMPEGQHPAVGAWAQKLLINGPASVAEAAADLLKHGTPEDLDTNTLSALGNLVSKALRRRVLLEVLRKNEWNLTRVSEELRAGGAGSIVRLIRDLGLSEEYRAARKAGAGKPGPKPR